MSIQLRSHQKEAVRISRTRPRFCFFWKPGTGKTIAMLAIHKYRPMRTLVVAQKSIFETAWLKDAKRMGVHCEIVWDKNRKRRIRRICTPGDIILVTNYEQFRTHRDLFLDTGVRRVIFDESSKLRNWSKKTAQSATEFADKMEEVYLLSGTPAPNCDTELWSQLRVTSVKAAGINFYKWAHHFFNPVKKRVTVKKKNKRTGKVEKKTISTVDAWRPKPGRDVFSHIRGWAWYLSKEECVDIPPHEDIIRYVPLSKSEKEAYKAASKAMVMLLGEDLLDDPDAFESQVRSVTIKTQSSLMKRRQVVGGFLIDDSKQPYQIGSSKIEALNDLIDEIGPKEPLLIWAEFTHEIDATAQLLEERGESYDIIDGRTKDSIMAIVTRFLKGETTRIIAHPKSAGHGTDGLQGVCAYSIRYSLSFSQEENEQSRDRLHRSGQKRKVTDYYLLGGTPDEPTVDSEMYEVVKGKTSRQEATLRELKRDYDRVRA